MSLPTTLPGYAVVTGAASGIGRALAKALVCAGVRGIALLDTNADGLSATHKMLESLSPNSSRSVTVLELVCDVSSPQAIEDAYSQANSAFGRIDYSLHCAGILRFGTSLDHSIEDFERVNSVNYRGLWLCQRTVLAIMQKQSLDHEAYPDAGIPASRSQRGAIVNISSAVGQLSIPQAPIYCATKAAVISLTRSDALDHALDRIRINTVMPGLIDTPMTDATPEMRKMLEAGPLQKAPVERFGQPEEIADVMVFLCSTGASFVTGAAWPVDGGYLAH